MALEIERKFLVKGEPWRAADSNTALKQGYLAQGAHCILRIRTSNDKGYLTIKSSIKGTEITRQEFEYEIPVNEAIALLALAESNIIEKTRYYLPIDSHIWEIDVFTGKHAGLVLAEIELTAEHEKFAKPDWLGEEVTDNKNYSNYALSQQ